MRDLLRVPQQGVGGGKGEGAPCSPGAPTREARGLPPSKALRKRALNTSAQGAHFFKEMGVLDSREG